MPNFQNAHIQYNKHFRTCKKVCDFAHFACDFAHFACDFAHVPHASTDKNQKKNRTYSLDIPAIDSII